MSSEPGVFTFAFLEEDSPEGIRVWGLFFLVIFLLLFFFTEIFKILELQQLWVEFIYNWTKLSAE